ncbi:uncharacterized protein LOC141902490 [Tubulanus polymorphus]|uniref:uncharacterized protein LOC141902490 n=1 Tax=Tubulanus polymorphus TaxID=672921 RepID=UPI003DA65E13
MDDPFLCSCKACTRFWKINFGKYSPELLQTSPICRTANTATLLWQKGLIKVGDRVKVAGKYPGLVKFVGSLDENLMAPEVYVGVSLYDNIGSTHNGVYDGKRYFHCARGHGAFVPYSHVRLITPPEKHPPIRGNYMFKNYEEIKKRRRLRRQKDPNFEIGMTLEERQMRRPSTSSSSTLTAGDPLDVKYLDLMKQNEKNARKLRRQSNSTVSLPEIPSTTTYKDKQFEKWKKEFGGGERGEKMARTLERLHVAFDKGLELENETNDSLYDY